METLKQPYNNALESINFAGMSLAYASATPVPLGASASQARLRAKFTTQRGVRWTNKMKTKLCASAFFSSLLCLGCGGTRSILKFENWNVNEIGTHKIFEAKGNISNSIFQKGYTVAVKLDTDSTTILLYGGNSFLKTGVRILNESAENINVEFVNFKGEKIKLDSQVISQTKNSFLFKNQNEVFLRFRLAEMNSEYLVKVHSTNKPWSEIMDEFQIWKSKNKIENI